MRLFKKLYLAALSISVLNAGLPARATLCFDLDYDKTSAFTTQSNPSVLLTISHEMENHEKIFSITFVLPENEDGTPFNGLSVAGMVDKKDPRLGRLAIDSFTQDGLHMWAVDANGQKSLVSADRFGWLHVHELDLSGSYKLRSVGAIHFASQHTQSDTLHLDGPFYLSGTIHAHELTISERTPSTQWAALAGLTIEGLRPPEDFCYGEVEFRKQSHMNVRQHMIKNQNPLVSRHHHGSVAIEYPTPKPEPSLVFESRPFMSKSNMPSPFRFDLLSPGELEEVVHLTPPPTRVQPRSDYGRGHITHHPVSKQGRYLKHDKILSSLL